MTKKKEAFVHKEVKAVVDEVIKITEQLSQVTAATSTGHKTIAVSREELRIIVVALNKVGTKLRKHHLESYKEAGNYYRQLAVRLDGQLNEPRSEKLIASTSTWVEVK